MSATSPGADAASAAPTEAIRPGRTGRQTGTVGVLNAAALLTLAVLVALAAAAWFVPLVVFFAIGAGAGYSLSGSV